MVTGNLAHKLQEQEKQREKDYTFLPDKPKHTSVSLLDIVNNKYRFDAEAFNLEAKVAMNNIKSCKYGYVNLWSEKGLIKEAYHRPRFKRIYLKKSEFPIYQPSQITEVYPKPLKYISEKTPTNIDNLKVKKGMVLLAVSGTIGKSSFVGKTLDNKIFSHDLLRVVGKGKNDAGYIYSYFQTATGLSILQSNNYGAVVQHIEPEHLESVIIPNAPEKIKQKVHELVVKSYDLRDQSNELIDKAEKILYKELQLPPIEKLQPKYFNTSKEIRNYETKLSDLNLRFDGSYHLPLVKAIENKIAETSKEVKTFEDKEIASKIILPGRFKRVYVSKENGIPFFGGKQLLELNPSNIKYLSETHHGNRISEQLFLKENMIAITCSGTIGKVNIIPKHWENWTLNQHVMRIVAKDKDIAGFIYCWLNSDYGYNLITRNVYGSVVDEIDHRHMATVKIPMLKNQDKQKEINDLVLKANKLRYEAHLKEQEAIRIVNEDVINVTEPKLNMAAESKVKYRKSNKN